MGYTSRMKTTIDVADPILLRAKEAAGRQRRTLRSLVEEGLVLVLDRLDTPDPHVVRPVTFRGSGLTEAFAGKGWAAIRDAAYGNPSP
jgi:hypothetical protein